MSSRERIGKARRSLNAWADGPATPSHDSRDLDHFTSYIERRAVVGSSVGFLLVVLLGAWVSDLIWGVPERLAVAAVGIPYWPVAWHFYLRHHYKQEFRDAPGSTGADGPGGNGEVLP